ncbi:MAG TPA: DUF2905 domain-containing protein [Ignavibacteria bacterium]|nr:DUF2905 domain-containing protein [Ignavibacteria bacterium]
MNSYNLGKILIYTGIVIVVVGGILMLFNRIPFIGKLPGDISIKGKNFEIYFPIVTCIVISIILSLIFYLIRYFKSN